MPIYATYVYMYVYKLQIFMLHISGLTAGDALGPAASRLNPQCTYFH